MNQSLVRTKEDASVRNETFAKFLGFTDSAARGYLIEGIPTVRDDWYTIEEMEFGKNWCWTMYVQQRIVELIKNKSDIILQEYKTMFDQCFARISTYAAWKNGEIHNKQML